MEENERVGPEGAAHDTVARPLSEALKGLTSLSPGERFTLSGLRGASKALFVASAFRSGSRPVLVVLPTEEEAESFSTDLAFFLGPRDALFYPSTELLPFETQPVHNDIQARRMEVLHRLAEPEPSVVVTSVANLMVRVMPRVALETGVVTIETGVEYPMDELIQRLALMGYSRMSMVEERGEMSVRGGIVDCFTPGLPAPLRIEFFGDSVESIRAFDITTQRSLERLKEARILPAQEAAPLGISNTRARQRLIDRADALGLDAGAWHGLSDKLRDGVATGAAPHLSLFYETLSTLFDYVGPSALVVYADPDSIAAEAAQFETEVHKVVERLVEDRTFFTDPAGLYLSVSDLDALIDKTKAPVVEIEPLRSVGLELDTESNTDLTGDLVRARAPGGGGEKREDGASGLLRPLIDRLQNWLEEGQNVYITAHNRGQAERTRELIEAYGVELGRRSLTGGAVLDNIMGAGEQGEAAGGRPCVNLAVGSLSSGFRLGAERVVVVSEEEVFGERVKRRAPPSKGIEAFLTTLSDLSVGDPVVHVRHGIALYRGLERITVDGVENEFLILEYKDGDKLYLPVLRTDLVGRYHGVEGSVAVADKLGGPGWERAKKKVKKAVEKLAGELLGLYAERAVAEGFAFSAPDHLYREFEASFEYEETPDQARAIEECLADMQTPRPMDRLVCGDVGYGKTEVALRAAFKAVSDSKQVAILVPTTVLAEQHFSTFTKRFAPYPVTVEVLSRFKSVGEQRETMKRLAAHRVDVIIGTHRLLGADVDFADLGLIVIDEEHRFGVAHKEKLKRIRKRVDVLTLTATPIPRTLHMSLAGIRELSIISTPPEDRLAVKTRIIGFDERIIAEAVEREMMRGGQVFFVHNRIESIRRMEEFLKRVVPTAKIAVAHGQMKERELERTMLAFVRGDCDLLLCTSIIESGLDIPRANTIIVDKAERFGLADLYQLRGRVGRSHHRAYAYFICPPTAALGRDAARRIEVVRELSVPGSGFKVATYDLEIRGAGELLGSAQSGVIAAVGFDLYASLLEEAVREQKGERVEEEEEPEINLRVSQFIPEDYVPDTMQRLSLYKRLASVGSEEELAGIADELIDRYGALPGLVENLIRTMELKLMLKMVGARELTERGPRLYIGFRTGKLNEKLGARLMEMIKSEPARFRAAPGDRLIVTIPPGADVLEEAGNVLKGLVRACYD